MMGYVFIIEESMGGWLKLEGEEKQQHFSFSLRAASANWFDPLAPRPFKGIARFGLAAASPVIEGKLTVRPAGPEYVFVLTHEKHGKLHFRGRKRYSFTKKMYRSMITCPLTVYQDGKIIGQAQVQYKESPWKFLTQSFRIVKAENAFGQYAL